MTTYENGQIVMFGEPEDDEREAPFIVVEDRDTRILVEEICDLPFPPQRAFRKSDIVPAPEQDLRQAPKAPRF